MTTEGHGHNCWLCHEPINALSGNPGLWPTPLIGDGKVRWWHMGCATKRMNDLDAALRELVVAFNPEPKFDYEPLGIWDRAAKVLTST